MKNNICYFLMSLLVLSCIILSIVIIRNSQQRAIAESSRNISNRETFYRTYIFNESELCSSLLTIDSSILREIFKNEDTQYKLIYKYDNHMCESCILNDIEKIRSGLPGISRKYVFIVAAIRNSREEEIKIINELTELDYLIIFNDKMKLSKRDNNSLKYYAVIDINGSVLSVFIPDENLPELTTYYLQEVSRKWFFD